MYGSPLTRKFANRDQAAIQGEGRFTKRSLPGDSACSVKGVLGDTGYHSLGSTCAMGDSSNRALCAAEKGIYMQLITNFPCYIAAKCLYTC